MLTPHFVQRLRRDVAASPPLKKLALIISAFFHSVNDMSTSRPTNRSDITATSNEPNMIYNGNNYC